MTDEFALRRKAFDQLCQPVLAGTASPEEKADLVDMLRQDESLAGEFARRVEVEQALPHVYGSDAETDTPSPFAAGVADRVRRRRLELTDLVRLTQATPPASQPTSPAPRTETRAVAANPETTQPPRLALRLLIGFLACAVLSVLAWFAFLVLRS